MRQNPSEDGLLRRYFLGEMSQEEMEALEKRLGDDELFELAEAVESDLLAAAARGELAPAERERVLRRLASSPQGRERLAFVRALNKAADEEKRATAPNVVKFPVRPIPQWASALAASLLVTAGLTFFVINKGNDGNAKTPVDPTPVSGPRDPVRPQPPRTVLTTPPAPAPVPPPPAPPDQLAGGERPPTPEPAKAAGRAVLQLALLSQRGGGIVDKLRLTPDIGVVENQLDVSEHSDFESFDVALRNQENQTVWRQNGLKPQALEGWSTPALVFEIDAAKLAAEGTYKLDVWGRAAGKEPQSLSYVELEVVTSEMP